MNSKDKENSGNIKTAIIAGVFTIIAACIGGGFLLLSTFIENGFTIQGPSFQANPNPTEPISQIQEPIDNPTATSAPAINNQYDGWVICWHGRDGYEYLIAYPESDIEQGLSLNFNLQNAQGREIELANDSLKMCYANGEWYGYPDPNPWFPSVSYLQLVNNDIIVCSDSPSCKGNQWTMLPENYFPSTAPELQEPNESGIHVITYIPSP